MKRFGCAGAVLAGLMWGPALQAQETTDWVAAKAAAREVYRQLEFMHGAIATIPGPPEGRGLYGQVDGAVYAAVQLQNRLQAKADRAALYLAFERLDGKVKGLLEDLKNFEAWNQALKFAAQRLQAAEHDLSFALAVGETDGKKKTDALYRQTLGLQGRVETLGEQIVFTFTGFDSLGDWKAAVQDLRDAITAFQRLQQKKADSPDLKAALEVVNQRWQRLTDKFGKLRDTQYILLQQGAAAVEGALLRIDDVFGIRGKARLPRLDF